MISTLYKPNYSKYYFDLSTFGYKLSLPNTLVLEVDLWLSMYATNKLKESYWNGPPNYEPKEFIGDII